MTLRCDGRTQGPSSEPAASNSTSSPRRRSGSRHPYPQRVAAHGSQPPPGGRDGRASVSSPFGVGPSLMPPPGVRGAQGADHLGSIDVSVAPARRRAPARRLGPGGALRPTSAGCAPLHVRSVRDRAASPWRHPGRSTSGERVTTTTPTASSSWTTVGDRHPTTEVLTSGSTQLASRAGWVVELLLGRPPVPKPASSMITCL
jgi:hypothetical protein